VKGVTRQKDIRRPVIPRRLRDTPDDRVPRLAQAAPHSAVGRLWDIGELGPQMQVRGMYETKGH
jgi:hypothetical protein